MINIIWSFNKIESKQQSQEYIQLQRGTLQQHLNQAINGEINTREHGKKNNFLYMKNTSTRKNYLYKEKISLQGKNISAGKKLTMRNKHLWNRCV